MVAPACTPPPVCRACVPVLSAETLLRCAPQTFRGWCLLATVVGFAQRGPIRFSSACGHNTARRATRRPCAVAFCDQLTGRRRRDAGGVHRLRLWMCSPVCDTPVRALFHRLLVGLVALLSWCVVGIAFAIPWAVDVHLLRLVALIVPSVGALCSASTGYLVPAWSHDHMLALCGRCRMYQA